jgi:1-deoxy-D-xylulose-5-phosphate reductoisomerase
MKTVAILGSTGSIGTQALEVVARNPDRLRVITLAAFTSVEKLAEQVRMHKPLLVSVKGPGEAESLGKLLRDLPDPPKIEHGDNGLEKTVTHPDVKSVLNGIVGSSGLQPTLSALREGREVLLANKESLVMAGELINRYLETGKGSLVPVDSEHSAIHQCLGDRKSRPGLSRIILTASGGPFRDRDPLDFESLSVSEALSHPTWKMGPKITIDSATMMNKGLEIIEAHHLFGLPPDRIEVVIHPASIVHSLVEFMDGSMLAQMSHPTMEIPIQYALLDTDRRETRVKPLDLVQVGKLEFYPPDSERFPALDIARRALELGGTAPAVLNAANEEAVKLFLAEKIRFSSITKLVEAALNNHKIGKATIENITASDMWAREEVRTEMSDYIAGSTNGIK